MAMTLTITCDRSSVEVIRDRTKFDILCGPMRARQNSVDFCNDCPSAFLAWRSAKPATPTPREVVQTGAWALVRRAE